MIGFDHVSFRYRRADRLAVSDVTIDFDRRAALILGVNGAGKSTLLRLMAGRLDPSSGAVRRCARHSMVPQSPVAVRGFTVAEQVAYAGWLKGLGGRDRQAVADAVDRVGMTPLMDRKVTTLSGGELARVGIACGLIGDIELLFLDEPSASLDPIARRSVHEVLADIVAGGMAIVATSHSATDLGPPFERIVVVEQGEVVHDGPREAFLAGHHAHPVVEGLADALRVRG